MDTDGARLTLDQIGIDEKSDKSSLVHGYLNSYGNLLARFRDAEIDFVEIGGRVSNHARMWRRFFSQARIFVIDASPSADLLEVEGVTVLRPETFDEKGILAAVGDLRPMVVIDDGTHLLRDQVSALNALTPILRESGLYVIEDLQTTIGGNREKYAADGATTIDLLAYISAAVVGAEIKGSRVPGLKSYVGSSYEEVRLRNKYGVLTKQQDAVRLLRRAHVDEFPRMTSSHTKRISKYSRVPANVEGASRWISQTFDALVGEGAVEMPAARSALLEGVTVSFGGVVIDNGDEGLIAAESLNCIQNVPETPVLHKLGTGEKWLAKRRFDEQVRYGKVPSRQHVLLKSPWDANYGHWLYDSLARLVAIEGMDLSGKPLLVVDAHGGAMAEVIVDSLELAGYGPEDVLVHDFRKDAWFESLVVPGLVSRHPDRKAPEATRFLESLGRDLPRGQAERLYLSRNSYSRRRLRNEDELWPQFEEAGFVKVATEGFGIREQISLFSGADVVAGNMGAAFSNLAFSPKGVRVLAIATEAMPHDFFYDITNHKGGTYVGVQGSAVQQPPDMSSDFTLDAEELRTVLEDLLG